MQRGHRVKGAAIAREAPVPAAPAGPTEGQLLAEIRDLLKARA